MTFLIPLVLSTPLAAAAPAVDPAPIASTPAVSNAGHTGWVDLFDGKTLTGWTEVGGPYDGDADWTVEDGAIVGREAEGARGGLLYTEKLYSDFEFETDCKINAPFDSGIFVRMMPKARGAQFTLDDRPNGDICGIYSNGWLHHETGGNAKWRSGEWCHVRVRCVGEPMHLVAWIDGECVLDYRVPEGYGDFVREGRIGIQVHGNMNDPEDAAVRFKNMRVRELPKGADVEFERAENGALSLTAVGEANGWTSLFNGVDLDGWEPQGMQAPIDEAEGLRAGYRVQDGELQALMKGASGNIHTARENYDDFELRLDFKISKLANSGLYLRSLDDGGNASFNGAEIQILDDFNWEEASGSKLKPYQFTGGLYGAQAPSKSALHPIGEWNTYQIWCVGPRMHCALNGAILWDVNTANLKPEQGAPFAERALRGFIGMQRHGAAGEVDHEVGASFRNLFLRELTISGGTR